MSMQFSSAGRASLDAEVVDDLLSQAESALEKGAWFNAVTLSDLALEKDPENAYAFLYKLMADLKISRTEELIYHAQPLDEHPLFHEALTRAGDELKGDLTRINQAILDRNKKDAYQKLVMSEKWAKTPEQLSKLAQAYKEFSGYLDADSRIAQCEQRAKELLELKNEKKRKEAERIEAERTQKAAEAAALVEKQRQNKAASARLFRDYFLTPLPVLAVLLLAVLAAKLLFFRTGWSPELAAMEKLPLMGGFPALVDAYADGALKTGILSTLLRVVGVLENGTLPFTIATVITGYLLIAARRLTNKRWVCAAALLPGFALSVLLLRLIPGLDDAILGIVFVVLLGIAFGIFPDKGTFVVWIVLLFLVICSAALWLDQTLLWFTLPGVDLKTFVDLVVLPWAVMSVTFILLLVADLAAYKRS